jgi:thermitase
MRGAVELGLALASTILLIVTSASAHRLQEALAEGEDFLVYLPVIGVASRIPNGDFEAGREIWTESSRWSNVLIVAAEDLPKGISPHNGDWAAWLGGDNDELAYVEQSVPINPKYPYLSYWHWIDSPFACSGMTGAHAAVSLNGILVHQTNVCDETDTGGWVQELVDLEAYAGQTAKLRFELTTAIHSYANWYLDDVDFQTAP